MNIESRLPKKKKGDPRLDGIIKLAVLAVGGQGGGVLTSWIVDLAERNGFAAQSTSIAGVAQRTGSTIYYVEMFPDEGRRPVFSLSPSPGDVDILIAAELTEAGRAVMRGFVTPERTALIASTHRAFAIFEKLAPGDAIVDGAAVYDVAEKSSDSYIAFDMEEIAKETGSVISACLFGALAGSGKLPFDDESYEKTIEASGRGVETSLKAFHAAKDRARSILAGGSVDAAVATGETPDGGARALSEAQPSGSAHARRELEKLTSRIDGFPGPVQEMALPGLLKVIDFQDTGYGGEYLDRINRVLQIDRDNKGENKKYLLSATAAKHIANAMAYDDIIAVADFKTRKNRFERIRVEAGYDDSKTLRITEYFHPGVKEFCSLLPARLGRYVEASPRLSGWIDRRVNRGRRVPTDTAFWFSVLYMVSGLRRFRRKLLRHAVEQEHLENWLETALRTAPRNYDLAVETLKCRRLIKGYSDTHARGLSKFDKVLSGIKLVEERSDAADWASRLLDAALADVKGETLEGAIQTIRSFENPGSSGKLS